MKRPSREIERIREVYAQNYPAQPSDRSYSWHPLNPIAVYYRQMQERALISLFNQRHFPLEQVEALDVGCGTGNFLRFLLGSGAQGNMLHGVDLIPERIERCRATLPETVNLQVGNAAQLPYPAAAFDLVSQFTMFSSILEQDLRQSVAGEMLRVARKGGYILWYDLRSGQSTALRGIPEDEILRLFPGCSRVYRKTLHPPQASRLAARSILLCNLMESLPFMPKTHALVLLQKG